MEIQEGVPGRGDRVSFRKSRPPGLGALTHILTSNPQFRLHAKNYEKIFYLYVSDRKETYPQYFRLLTYISLCNIACLVLGVN